MHISTTDIRTPLYEGHFLLPLVSVLEGFHYFFLYKHTLTHTHTYTHTHTRATEQRLTVMAPILLTGLYKIVERPDEVNLYLCMYVSYHVAHVDSQESKMKAMTYTGVGLLAQ